MNNNKRKFNEPSIKWIFTSFISSNCIKFLYRMQNDKYTLKNRVSCKNLHFRIILKLLENRENVRQRNDREKKREKTYPTSPLQRKKLLKPRVIPSSSSRSRHEHSQRARLAPVICINAHRGQAARLACAGFRSFLSLSLWPTSLH